MKKILLMTFSLCLIASLSFAQRPQGPHGPHKHKHHPKLSKEAKEELKTFQKEKVYPVKKAAHDKFEAGLSSDDLAFLQTKREEGKALKEEGHKLHKQARALKESGMTREQMQEKRKELFAPMKEKHMAFMKSMKPFMERNKELLKGSLEDVNRHKEAWKTEKKAIMDKHMTTEQKEKMAEHKKKHEEKRAENPERAKKHGKHKKHFGAVKFVLWDGEMREHKECKKGEKKGDSSSAKKESSSLESVENTTVMNLSSYPNPAMTQTTIIFELKEATKKVKVVITDAQGKVVWKKNYSKLNAGEHKLDVDLQNFANGQYFYTLEVNGEQLSKTLVVNQ